jgi:hypothetical protein
MRSTFRIVLTSVLLFGFLFSPVTAQTPDDPMSARDGSILDTSNPLPERDMELTTDFSEGFEDITTLPTQGWALINKSDPIGLTGWFQGNDTVFPAHTGEPTHYISANFNNTTGVGTISNWLIMPTRLLKNGDTLTFFTRTTAGSTWPDRLEVRLSSAGDSVDVGVGALDVGVFDQVLLSINPTLVVDGYPTEWTQFTIQIQLSQPVIGRLAFRYFVTNGGPSGSNSNYIGIDTVSYVEGPWVTVLPLILK